MSAALPLLFATLPVSFASAATTPVERIFYTVDTGLRTLVSRAAPTGPASAPLTASDVDVELLTTSRDGSRLADVETVYSSPGGTPMSERVVVRDVSGRIVRTIDQITYGNLSSGRSNFSNIVLSPDGNTITYQYYDLTAGHAVQRRAHVASGTPSSVVTPTTVVAFVDSSTVLLRNKDGSYSTQAVAGGPLSPVIGLPVGASDLALDSTSTHLAWTSVNNATGQLQVAPVSTAVGPSGETLSVGAATTLAQAAALFEPTFSKSGETLYFLGEEAATGYDWVYAVPADGSAPAARTDPSSSDITRRIALGITDDGTPPGPASTLPAVLNGSGATIRWTLPGDPDLSGVLLSRRLGSAVQKSNVYIPAPVGSYVDTGLTLNTTYTYTLTTVDRSGNLGPAVTRYVTALKPGASFSDPTSANTTHAPFPVRFAASAPSSSKFTVDYLPAGSTTYRRWVTAATGLTRTFGVAATSGVAATASTLGSTYTFRVLATDAYGNSTPFIGSGKAVVPYDQTKASFVGGRNVYSVNDWLGSQRILSTAGSTAKLSIAGNRLQIIGERCTTCGVIDIYDGTTRIAAIDTYRSAQLLRSVLYTRTWTATGTHAITLKVRGTAGRPNVILDGWGVRR